MTVYCCLNGIESMLVGCNGLVSACLVMTVCKILWYCLCNVYLMVKARIKQVFLPIFFFLLYDSEKLREVTI